MVEAEQLKIWHGEVEAWCRFRPGSPVLLRFRVGGKPAHGLPIDKGTFTDFRRVSFVSFFHLFLPLFNFFNLALARRAMNDSILQSRSSPFFQWLISVLRVNRFVSVRTQLTTPPGRMSDEKRMCPGTCAQCSRFGAILQVCGPHPSTS